METLSLDYYWDHADLQIAVHEYTHGWTALEFIDVSIPDQPEPFAYATVWLDVLMPGFAYLDVNNFPNIEEIFKDHKLWEPAHRTRISGFVEYPLYRLNMDEINKYLYPTD